MSQGDIYEAAPIWLPPIDPIDPWDVTAGAVMVLTASCQIDKQPQGERLILVAPVVDLEPESWHPADLSILKKDDCVHGYMYLPAESEWPERTVDFYQAQPLRFDLLSRCVRQTQLTYVANQQLMRKLTMFYSTAHVAVGKFEPWSDDFPGLVIQPPHA